ncbi:MAG: RNA polymerase sigma factor [Kangiellaceae bacterium]|jgi:RNA polymerase sigma-70 factor (ECF subfamily)|nr:RNA polymerase sigma factor [Kangiellaceae bacterium]
MELSKQQYFHSVIEQFEGAIHRLVMTYEHNTSLQDELKQDILLAIWSSLDDFQKKSNIKTYMYRVMLNTCFSYIAKQQKHSHREELKDESCNQASPEKQFTHQQNIKQLMIKLKLLPASQQQVALLTLEGMNYSEISEITGLSKSNVGVLLNRAKQKLAQ